MAFLAVQTAGAEGTWKNLNAKKDYSVDLFLDTSSVNVKDGYVFYRIRLIRNQNKLNSICWLESNCSNNKSALLACRDYNRTNDKTFYNYNNSRDFEPLDKTLPAHLVHKAACEMKSEIMQIKDSSEVENINELKSKYINNSTTPYWKTYMAEVEKSIKANWHPPRAFRSNRIIVIFKIDKKGNLLDYEFKKPSKNKKANEAVIEALKATAPFKPLPKEYKGNSVPIEFSFDYNIIR